MKITSNAGVSIEVDAELGLLLNGKPPHSIVPLGDNWYRATTVAFCRIKRPAKANGIRKRKKALMAAVKRYRFSFNFKRD